MLNIDFMAITNSVDPDEMRHSVVSSGSSLFVDGARHNRLDKQHTRFWYLSHMPRCHADISIGATSGARGFKLV